MTAKFQELVAKLKEIFQLDKPELDFGIYRIMHTREKEITDFLENRLAEKVKAAFAGNSAAEKAAYEKDLAEKIAQAKSLNMDPDAVPAVKELREKISALGNDEDAKAAVYAHLLAFFSRYYDAGDFMSKRRYKDGVYAIPYSGEEVKLYWANADQYYTKSGENFTNYDFKLSDGHKVHFSLVTAETAKDNIKDTEAIRCFVLWDPSKKEDVEDEELKERMPDSVLEEKDGELYIYLQYLKFKKSKEINQNAFTNAAKEKIYAELGAQHLLEKYNLTALAPTEKDKNRTILDKHFSIYTTKNTSDYFIHKDLKGFLTRELDFYIKNEMMHLDDIQSATAFKDIERNLSLIQTVRLIASELIEFIAQLEEFQKKLWLKKKFVVQCDYCITLDRVPEELRAKVFENKAQLEEWKKLGFEEIGAGGSKQKAAPSQKGKQGELALGSEKRQDSLDARMVDTKFFNETFKTELLKSIPNFDEQVDGLLVHADNYQALNFMKERYEKEITCIYIDPPYNTDATPIIYKNGYKESSWLSLMDMRLRAGKFLLKSDGYHSVAIDDTELHPLCLLIKSIFTNDDLFQVMVNHYPGSGTGRTNVSKTHEYNLFIVPSEKDILRGKEKPAGERTRGFCRSGTGENNYRSGRPNSFYAVLVDTEKHIVCGVEKPPAANDEDYPQGFREDGLLRVYPIGADGSERCWSLGYDAGKIAAKLGDLICSEGNKIQRLYHDESARELLPSMWIDKKYSASTNGTNLLTNLFGKSGLFSFPKSIYTVYDAINAGLFNNKDGIVLDYFAGSGTTGHAVIDLNRDDLGRRKYILIEMGDHFDTVLKPRIEKIVYSTEWKDGKPLKPEEGISHCFKYMTLESYEDALNNIELENKGELLEGASKDEYLLSYMLDIESKGSIINTDDFKHPFDYSLKIAIDSSGASEKRKVDLVETFNYLIGLRVAQYVRQIDKGYCFLDGTLPSGEKTFVLWRDCKKINDDELNKLFAKFGIKPGATEYDVIYVNGDHAVANVKLGEEEEGKKLKVRQIENEFLEKMFGETK